MKGSFAAYARESMTEVTFHYIEGHTEAFLLPMSPQEFQQQVMTLLQQPWLTFHLVDQTVMIATTGLVKVEIQPPVAELDGVGVFHNAQRMTAMQRNVVHP